MDTKLFTYYAALIIATLVLFWGLRIIARALESAPGGKPLVKSVLAEEPEPGEPDIEKGSFSRTAGAFGAMGLAMATIGIGYWVIYTLFFAPTELKNVKEIWPYFLSASALFAPYAFNRLSKTFK